MNRKTSLYFAGIFALYAILMTLIALHPQLHDIKGRWFFLVIAMAAAGFCGAACERAYNRQ